jgi:ribosomal-protein-serine acetyltransferase
MRSEIMADQTFIHALDHVQLAMPQGQEDAARAFYGGLLGFHEVAKPENLAGRGGVWFESCSVKLHLSVESDFRPARKAHPALLVFGLNALVARLQTVGVATMRDEPLTGFDRVHVSDPFGNRIELMEPTESPSLLDIRISERHRLRLPSPSDAEELFRLTDANRHHLRQWLPWVDNATCPNDRRPFIESGLRQFANRQGFHAVICYDEQIVGVIGFHSIDWLNRSTSIGYWLSESHQGQGLMTASCRAIIDYAFETWGLNRIAIRCATGNHRSQAVVERLGFTREGVQREAEWLYDHFLDLVNYALLRSEWKKER